ncbi:MAG: hypothetical protein EOP04_14960 [Proteobacteria bacterium]|nr:MAG: hypothetical protein EOP04_14960 [Pseudomonadota bacterium]
MNVVSSMTLTFQVKPGYRLTLTSFSFYNRSTADPSTGYKNWRMTINGTEVGADTLQRLSVPLLSTGTLPIAGPLSALTGTVTVVLYFSNSIGGTGTVRIDNFVLNGFVQQIPNSSNAPITSADGKGYRYGFNGQERGEEVGQDSYGATYWEYDSRIGRRWNRDPIYKHSPYEVFGNNPLVFADPNGLDTVKNKSEACPGDIWGHTNGNTTFYYKFNGKNWENAGNKETKELDEVTVSRKASSKGINRAFAVAVSGLLVRKETIVGIEALLEGTGVRLANASLSSTRFLGPAGLILSTIAISGDNVTPKHFMQWQDKDMLEYLEAGDLAGFVNSVKSWNDGVDESRLRNRIVFRYMSMAEFNNRIQGDKQLPAAPPLNASGVLSQKFITPNLFITSAAAKTFLALPTAPDILIWCYESEIMATKIPSGPGVYSPVKPKYGEPGGGREAIIVQPFPIHGFIPLIQ